MEQGQGNLSHKNLMQIYSQDSFVVYEKAIKGLSRIPNSPELQHQVVLALARAGSLEFAWAEYQRYKLDKFTSSQDKNL